MVTAAKHDTFSALEEGLHTLSHGLGVVLAIIAMVFLVAKASAYGGTRELVAASVFASSAIILYVCSTLYHGAYRSQFQPFFKILDHAAIYIKIAGSYTPFALLILSPGLGVFVLVLVWVLAAMGVTLKCLAPFWQRQFPAGRRLEMISLIGYLGMGWIAIFVAGDLWRNLPAGGFAWLVAGGLCFTVGAGFFAWKSRAYTHAIWHIFVLAGSICHFVSIYGYVLPGRVV